MNNNDLEIKKQVAKRQREEIEVALEYMNSEMEREAIRKGIRLTIYLNKFQKEFNGMNIDFKKTTLQYIINYINTIPNDFKEIKEDILNYINAYEVTYDQKNISTINWSFLTKFFDNQYVADLLCIMKDM